MVTAGDAAMLFDQIAVVLVTTWFLAGLWLVVQSVLRPRPMSAAGDGDGE